MNKTPIRVPIERVEKAILLVRGEKVIPDTDLAALYDVETRSLLQAVKRNSERFPSDFMFQLTRHEFDSLRSQTVISKGKGGRRYLPYVFTEHGAIMAANVLTSERAVEASVQVVRAFIRLRQMLASNAELARKLSELENKYDTQFKVVFDAIRQLMTPPVPKRKLIGFKCLSKAEWVCKFGRGRTPLRLPNPVASAPGTDRTPLPDCDGRGLRKVSADYADKDAELNSVPSRARLSDAPHWFLVCVICAICGLRHLSRQRRRCTVSRDGCHMQS